MDPLDLLLGTEELAFEVLVLVLHVLLLDLDRIELALYGHEAAVEIIFIGSEEEGGWGVEDNCCRHLWWGLVAVVVLVLVAGVERIGKG